MVGALSPGLSGCVAHRPVTDRGGCEEYKLREGGYRDPRLFEPLLFTLRVSEVDERHRGFSVH